MAESALGLAMPNVALAEAEPASSGDFLLGEELDAFLALHVQVAEERFVPAVEGEPGHRGGHTDIDANHATLDAVLELARGLAGAREDGCPVAVRRTVGLLDRGVQILKAHHVEDR